MDAVLRPRQHPLPCRGDEIGGDGKLQPLLRAVLGVHVVDGQPDGADRHGLAGHQCRLIAQFQKECFRSLCVAVVGSIGTVVVTMIQRAAAQQEQAAALHGPNGIVGVGHHLGLVDLVAITQNLDGAAGLSSSQNTSSEQIAAGAEEGSTDVGQRRGDGPHGGEGIEQLGGGALDLGPG